MLPESNPSHYKPDTYYMTGVSDDTFNLFCDKFTLFFTEKSAVASH